jgi:cytidylate kinase
MALTFIIFEDIILGRYIMAVITISRQVAAHGDEIAQALAEKINYKFIDRKHIEARIVELGFPLDKLPKYDERKPGFFASLVKERDEYLNYLQFAVLEAASQGNVILIGRGAFIILEELSNLLALRFVARDAVRLERLKKEFNWNDKQAQARIDESDANRLGFHKSFFNLVNEEPQHFHMVLNTGLLSIDESVNVIESLLKSTINSKKEADGKAQIERLLEGQRLVNRLLFDAKLNINFLRAVVKEDNSVVLHGVADSQALVEKAVNTAANLLPSSKIESAISVVRDYKAYS